ncbi:ribbon-helix-helix protein, CopG family [Gluconobacter aidae]|mgnify:FL=1|nr:ribbon-helix-helix protein, CopG family [Gluconobacter aidae]
MASPLSIRLDERLRTDLEQEAKARGIPLSQLIRDLLETGAKSARRDRIRRDSARVADYVAATPSALALFDEAGGT